MPRQKQQSSAVLIERYDLGLSAYHARDWTTATAHFRGCLEIAPRDGPAEAMLGRIAEFQTDPPPQDWDGAFTMQEK